MIRENDDVDFFPFDFFIKKIFWIQIICKQLHLKADHMQYS